MRRAGPAWSCCARCRASGRAACSPPSTARSTGAGARELAARLASPLRDAEAIAARLDAVGFLREDETLRDDLRGALRAAPDIARAISRLALQRGGPRDLAAVRDGLATAGGCARLLREGAGGIGLPEALAAIAADA